MKLFTCYHFNLYRTFYSNWLFCPDMLTVSEQLSVWWILTSMEIEPVTFLSPLRYRMNCWTTMLPLPLKETLVVNTAIHTVWPLVRFVSVFYNLIFPYICTFSGGFTSEVRWCGKCSGKLVCFSDFLIRIQTLRTEKRAKARIVCTSRPPE